MSPRTYAIYIPKSARVNLRIGLTHGTWGWHGSAFVSSDSAAVVRSMKQKDLLLMARGGPNPRVPPHGWAGARMAGIDVCEVVRESYRSTSPVWPDDVYPERIGIRLIDSLSPRINLGPETLEALRMSANKRGVAVMVSSTTPDWWRSR